MMEDTVSKETPYQLDLVQTSQACKVLLRHIAEERERRNAEVTTSNLLQNDGTDDEEDQTTSSEEPIWLILTTKKHIVDQKRLKPGKIVLPHPINASASSTICLITADPQPTYSAIVASPSFPAHLRSRIAKTISLSVLKKNYATFEARRQLAATYDIFLADDRIVTYLPSQLGKVFYKGGSKRPIPVNIAEPRKDENGKRIKLDPANAKKSEDKIEGGRGAAKPEAVAREVEKALSSAVVNLAPGTSTAVKFARAGMSVEQMVDNVQAVVEGLVNRFVTKGWRNIRAVHIKGPNTMAFPVWFADELWMDDEDVLEEKKVFGKKTRSLSNGNSEMKESALAVDEHGRKRKADEVKKPTVARHVKKKRKVELEAKQAAESARRKESRKQHKEALIAEIAS